MILLGNWCPLDAVLYAKGLTNTTIIVAPISKDYNVEYSKKYFENILKGKDMEVIKIENNIATLSNGVVTRHIDLNKDYLTEVNKALEETKEKLKYYEEIKENIFDDQQAILKFLIKGGEKND